MLLHSSAFSLIFRIRLYVLLSFRLWQHIFHFHSTIPRSLHSLQYSRLTPPSALPSNVQKGRVLSRVFILCQIFVSPHEISFPCNIVSCFLLLRTDSEIVFEFQLASSSLPSHFSSPAVMYFTDVANPAIYSSVKHRKRRYSDVSEVILNAYSIPMNASSLSLLYASYNLNEMIGSQVQDDSNSGKSHSPSLEDRRAHHNELERRRRDHIKDHFMVLRDSIPLIDGEKVKYRSFYSITPNRSSKLEPKLT